MTFDPENIPLILNDWFSTQIVYDGRGRAEFLDPAGAVEGPVRIQVNENGTSSIELDVESIESEEPLPLGLINSSVAKSPSRGGDGLGSAEGESRLIPAQACQ